MSDNLRNKLVTVLIENGVKDTGDGIHSWRCSYPERYGECGCFEVLVEDLIELIEGHEA